MSASGGGNGGGGDLETFLVSQARMPGYTGFRPGVRAVNAKTPALAQASAAAATATATALRDGGWGGAAARSAEAAPPSSPSLNNNNLFPVLQAFPGPQPSARKDESAAIGVAPGGLDHGDAACRGAACRSARSTASEAFAAPSAAFARVRSPMRNKELERLSLAAAPTAASSAALLSRYASAQSRVGPAALRATLARMRERLLAKVTNSGDNAFRVRRLFRAYDAAGTGRVALEDFRSMGEAFGLQLGDDVLLSLFAAWDPLGTGSLPYEPLVATMLGDADAFALYAPERAAADNAQASADARLAAGVARELAASARGGAAAVRHVLGAMSAGGGGKGAGGCAPSSSLLPWAAFGAGMASVGLALSPQQQAFVCDARNGFVTGGGGGGGGGGGEGVMVDWQHFCDALDKA